MAREQQVYFRVTDEIYERLVNQAKRRGVSIPDIVRFMVADRLDWLEKESSESEGRFTDGGGECVGKAAGG